MNSKDICLREDNQGRLLCNAGHNIEGEPLCEKPATSFFTYTNNYSWHTWWANCCSNPEHKVYDKAQEISEAEYRKTTQVDVK